MARRVLVGWVDDKRKECGRTRMDGRQMEKSGKMKKTDTAERGVNWGAVAVFLQAVERKAGILRRMAGQARDGVAELEEREFERRMAHIYRQLNLAWNGRHGNAFAPEPEELARRESFPEALRKEGEG